MDGGPSCQIILEKLSSGLWTKKQNPDILEPDDPGNHPAQPLPKYCPHIINPPRCSMKKEKSSAVTEVLEKENSTDSPVGDSLCTLT